MKCLFPELCQSTINSWFDKDLSVRKHFFDGYFVTRIYDIDRGSDDDEIVAVLLVPGAVVFPSPGKVDDSTPLQMPQQRLQQSRPSLPNDSVGINRYDKYV